MLKRWLAHPLTRNLGIDDPRTTELRREIIRQKPFLRRIYEEWYRSISSYLGSEKGPVLEIGSGGGFLKEIIPGMITSEVFRCRQVDVVLNGFQLPFGQGELQAIVMTDVFHHISEPRSFLREAARCLRPAGLLLMIEPWVTNWSRLVYRKLHHEPFRPDAAEWEFPASGPLSGANGALPWIIFSRDRNRFESEFPHWQVEAIERMMPFRYLVSGGVSLRNLMPGWSYRLWGGLEAILEPWMPHLAMFAQIVLRRI